MNDRLMLLLSAFAEAMEFLLAGEHRRGGRLHLRGRDRVPHGRLRGAGVAPLDSGPMVEVDHGETLRRLAEAADALAGELGLEAVLERIVETAARVTGARYAALGVLGQDGAISRFVPYGVTEEQIEAIGPFPTGKGILGLLIREPRVIRLDDIQAHPASYGFPPEHPPMTTFLGAPVRSGGQIFGNLYLTEKPGGFDEHDEQVIVVLAAEAGAAIENAILSDKLQDLAVREERDRLARELHDGVIQSLFSIGMGLESARGLIEQDPDRVRARIDTAVDSLDAAIRELRNHIFRLRPQRAAELGLEGGLRELAREFEVNALVRPALDVPSSLDARVPERIVPDLLQIVREALSNTAKHAGASEVRVQAGLDGNRIVVEVADDGSGFSPGQPVVGRGLDNIRDRVEALRGDLEITSAPDTGTRVRVSVPLT
jgi:signal transduction histidine kinase